VRRRTVRRPPKRQGAPAIGQRGHEDLPATRKLDGVHENTNALLTCGGGAKQPPGQRRLQSLRVNGLVGQEAAHLLGLAREASRPEAVAGNLGQMHMLGQMQAAHQPSKIAALRAAQVGHLLAKPLAYLTLKAKAVAHRQGVASGKLVVHAPTNLHRAILLWR